MGLSREPYGCVRLHDSACLLISENILQEEDPRVSHHTLLLEIQRGTFHRFPATLSPAPVQTLLHWLLSPLRVRERDPRRGQTWTAGQIVRLVLWPMLHLFPHEHCFWPRHYLIVSSLWWIEMSFWLKMIPYQMTPHPVIPTSWPW